MKKCCRLSFKRAIEEVLFTIETAKPESVEELRLALKYAVKLLEEEKDESV